MKLAKFTTLLMFWLFGVSALAQPTVTEQCELSKAQSTRGFEYLESDDQRLYFKLALDEDDLIARALAGLSSDIRGKLLTAESIYHRREITDGKLIVSIMPRSQSPETMDEAERRISAIIPKAGFSVFAQPKYNFIRESAFTFEVTVADFAREQMVATALERSALVISNRLGESDPADFNVRVNDAHINLSVPPVDNVDAFKQVILRPGSFYLAMGKSIGEGPKNSSWKLLPFLDDAMDCMWVDASNKVITAVDIRSAEQGFDEFNRPQINFTLSPSGTQKFSQMTLDHPNELFGIVLDGQIISAPRINDPIFGAGVRITGDFSLQEAQYMARVINSGDLPARLIVIEDRLINLEELNEINSAAD